MIAFKVSINGEVVALSGLEHLSVLSAVIDAVGVLGPSSLGTVRVSDSHELKLSVGGLGREEETDPGVSYRWHSGELAVGDEVSVKIVDVVTADAPFEQLPQTEVDREERERASWERARDEYFKGREKFDSGRS